MFRKEIDLKSRSLIYAASHCKIISKGRFAPVIWLNDSILPRAPRAAAQVGALLNKNSKSSPIIESRGFVTPERMTQLAAYLSELNQ